MSFDYRHGFLHFVFAGIQDSYYQASLSCMSFSRYLWYSLYKAGYKGIYFIKDWREGAAIYMEDKPSAGAALAFARGEALAAFQNAAPEENGFVSRLGNEDVLRETVQNALMSPKDKFALVFTLETFDHLFAGEHAAAFEKAASYRQESILVLVGTLTDEENRPYLLNTESPLHSDICPEILKIEELAEKGNFRFFERFSQLLDRRYICEDPLGEEKILRMLESGLLLKGWRGELDDAADMAAFIHSWYYSPKMKAAFPGILPDNDWREIREVEEWLESPDKNKALQEAVNKARSLRNESREADQPLSDFLSGRYAVRAFEGYPYPQRQVSAVLLEGMDIASYFVDKNSEIASQSLREFRQILSIMDKGYVEQRLDPGEVSYCVGELENFKQIGHGMGLSDAASRIIHYLYYCASSTDRQTNPLLFKRKSDYHREIIKWTKSLLEKQALIDRLRKEEADTGRQLSRLAKELKTRMANAAEGETDWEIESMKREVLRLNPLYKKKPEQIRSLLTQCEALDEAIDTIIVGMDYTQDENLESLQQKMKDLSSHMREQNEQYMKLSRSLEEEEEKNQNSYYGMSEEDIDKAFSEIVDKIEETDKAEDEQADILPEDFDEIFDELFKSGSHAAAETN